jgi:nitrogen fixation NifU-like protein
MDIYREQILDHYQNPRNFGDLEPADIVNEDSNPLCGDQCRMSVRLDDGLLSEVKFRAQGCAISLASASMLTEELRGKSLAEVENLDKEFIQELLGVPLSPIRLKCALLPLMVIKAGIAKHKAESSAR